MILLCFAAIHDRLGLLATDLDDPLRALGEHGAGNSGDEFVARVGFQRGNGIVKELFVKKDGNSLLGRWPPGRGSGARAQ